MTEEMRMRMRMREDEGENVHEGRKAGVGEGGDTCRRG